MRDAEPTWAPYDVAPPKRFDLIPFDRIIPGGAPAYLIKGLLPRVGLAVMWGPPKCGKSFLAFDLMMHVALGWAYRDRRVQQGAIVYCVRFQSACRGLPASKDGRPCRRAILTGADAAQPHRRSSRARSLDPN